MATSYSINSDAVRTEYITGNISMRKLAVKHGVSYNTICRNAAKEKWFEQRQRYRAEVAAKTVVLQKRKDVEKLQRLIDATNAAVDVGLRALSDPRQFNRYLITDGVKAREVEIDKVDSKALRDMVGCIKDLTVLLRDFYNLPTPAQEEAQRINAERLELEKRKIDAGDDDDNETGVVLLPEVGSGDDSVVTDDDITD